MKKKKCGLVKYQILYLSYKINKLKTHIKNNPKDISNKMSLIKMISKRKKMNKYLEKRENGEKGLRARFRI
ncbi:30S ribosomal protein S15 [Candidatus Vidania fulgoroideorum]